jgi:sigma-E factor negative regulatory protein RseB
MLKSADSQIARHYTATRGAGERVAGVDADLVVLKPKDPWRYGYRVWSERQSGLVVKLQTLDVDGKVLEQAAFSELQLDAPVSMSKLTEMMANTQGYTVERQELTKTSAESEGWNLKTRVEGFEPLSCYVRPMPAAEPGAARSMLQWVFGDGLASVSLFVEPFDRNRHVREGSTMVGATRMLTRRLSDKGGEWWITAVGEVPQATLVLFAQSLVRTR